jgi:hypothetical protein
MRGAERALLAVCGAVLDFAWLYAWAAFSMISLEGDAPALLYSAAIFAAAALLTALSAGRGLRIISVGVLQSAGIVAAALWTVYVMSGATGPLLDNRWIAGFFGTSHSAMEWLGLGVALFWSTALWLGGAFFAVRPRTHHRICSRFDLGLAAFFTLVLIKLALAVKGNILVGDTMTGPLAFVFFFFGLVAIGMTRTGGREAPGLVRGRRKFGVVLGFICAVFLSAMGLVVFFQQPLARAAGTGYGLLTGGAASVGSIFLWFIRLLYMPRQGKLREAPGGSGPGGPGYSFTADSEPWMETVGRILAWLFGTALGIVILVVAAMAAFYVIRWLLSRTEKRTGTGRYNCLLRMVLRFRDLLVLLAGRTRRLLRRHRTAADVYRALAGWSKRSGIRRGGSETTREFSSRLSGTFPSLANEIGSITEAFNRELYGQMAITGEEMALLKANQRRLASPSFWPARLRALITGQVTPRS